MVLFHDNLLSPHCNIWLTTLVGLWCPEHVLLMSGKMLLSEPRRQVPGWEFLFQKVLQTSWMYRWAVFPLCHTSERSHTCREQWVIRPVIELCSESLKNSSVKQYIWSTAITKAESLSDFHLISLNDSGEGGGQTGAWSNGLFVVLLRCSWVVIRDGLNHRSPESAWRVPALWCGGAFHTIFRWVVKVKLASVCSSANAQQTFESEAF